MSRNPRDPIEMHCAQMDNKKFIPFEARMNAVEQTIDSLLNQFKSYMSTNCIAKIPPISVRGYRSCTGVDKFGKFDRSNRCVWYDAKCRARYDVYLQRYGRDDPKVCCRFHLTETEHAQILDPYFME